MEHRKSSIYYPQSNGIIERVHRTMKESIASLSNKVIEWSDRLAFFKLYCNNSKHIVTGFTPVQLFFGREINTPLDTNNEPATVDNPSQYLLRQRDHIKATRELVKQNEEKYFSVSNKVVKGREPTKI
ncbi:uncharacterized protein K02A2.6-like [Stegodyphus dumicola]|uniref:uncharacterized protein K02A2.6-like n=1 Tax=Stegodyphus dumicola TaxID=202533 RepID=UPI0015ACDC42|nr:uncharacterized protein K02A2.6-like [Stegodyphus dumicola]